MRRRIGNPLLHQCALQKVGDDIGHGSRTQSGLLREFGTRHFATESQKLKEQSTIVRSHSNGADRLFDFILHVGKIICTTAWCQAHSHKFFVDPLAQRSDGSGFFSSGRLRFFAASTQPGSTTEVVHESRVGAREYPSDLGEYG
jgi:hypothetical protein